MKTPDISQISKWTLEDFPQDNKFWHSRTPEERLKAMLRLNQLVYGYDRATARMNKVLEIVKRSDD